LDEFYEGIKKGASAIKDGTLGTAGVLILGGAGTLGVVMPISLIAHLFSSSLLTQVAGGALMAGGIATVGTALVLGGGAFISKMANTKTVGSKTSKSITQQTLGKAFGVIGVPLLAAGIVLGGLAITGNFNKTAPKKAKHATHSQVNNKKSKKFINIDDHKAKQSIVKAKRDKKVQAYLRSLDF